MIKTKNKIITVILFLISIIYTFLVKYIDVKAIGPNNSEVGFATINNWFHNLTGVNEKLYKISEYTGYCVLLIILIYALIGFIQLIKRKDLFKVDRELFLLAFLYLFMLLVYICFEKIVINHRPVLIDGILEASYPSSHTMLALCICLSSILVNKKLWPNKTKIVNIIIAILGIIVLIGRLLSGYHWLSDIFGGIIMSMALIMLFYTFLVIKKSK